MNFNKLSDEYGIKRSLATGLPYRRIRKYPRCAICGEEISGQFVNLEGDTYCLECLEYSMSATEWCNLAGIPVYGEGI